jgi:hypothetical protein
MTGELWGDSDHAPLMNILRIIILFDWEITLGRHQEGFEKRESKRAQHYEGPYDFLAKRKF